MVYKLLNGMLLFQLRPSFFYSREDLFTLLFMQTGLPQWLLNNLSGCILFDALFYLAPVVYFLHYKFTKNTAYISVIVMLLINWSYVQCYTLYASNSIEGHIAWLLFPFAFMAKKEKTFLLLMEALRYFFLFFFVSAGLWKLRQYGAFNNLQMSAVLLSQHIQMLTNSPDYWQSRFIMWLIKNPQTSYWLYLMSTFIELSFMTGFFTKKADKILIGLFLLFLIMDNLVMRIPYYEVLPLLLTLYPGTNEKISLIKNNRS